MKHDSTRQAGTGVGLAGLKGNGGHEVQGVAISLGAGHGRPARMREGQHPFPPAGSGSESQKLDNRVIAAVIHQDFLLPQDIPDIP